MNHHLFCKPDHTGIICKALFSPTAQRISFQSLDLIKHLPEIHQWVNLPYAEPFWHMGGSMGLLRSCYQCIMQNPNAHSFVGMLDGRLFCQLDVYRVQADELAHHLRGADHDAGFHLIISPPDHVKPPVHGITVAFVALFLRWYFSFPQAKVMWAEPDIRNNRSIRLLQLLGFSLVKTIDMSYKTAKLYKLEKCHWPANHPSLDYDRSLV